MNLLTTLTDIFFPKVCISCGKPLRGDSLEFCQQCFPLLRRASVNSCSCGLGTRGECCFCSSRQCYFDGSASLLEYDDRTRSIVSYFKNGRRFNIVNFFADEAAIILETLFPEVDFVSSIPPSSTGKRKRGFDQGKMLAVALARRLKCSYRSVLYFCTKRSSQKVLHRHMRYFGIISAFKVKSPGVFGKNILLVDDVLTTGATLNEASRMLKKSGAAKIFLLTLARVSDNSDAEKSFFIRQDDGTVNC